MGAYAGLGVVDCLFFFCPLFSMTLAADPFTLDGTGLRDKYEYLVKTHSTTPANDTGTLRTTRAKLGSLLGTSSKFLGSA